MARGVTEADVARACDALLVAGERPTVERVRQHLGSGSPNTVGPHLDAWFKGLGARIVNPQGLASQAGLPETIQEAANRFWAQAVKEASSDIDQRVAQGLADAVANVEAAKERARIAEASAYDAGAKATRLATDLEVAQADLQRERLSRAALEAQLGESRSRVAELQAQDELRQKQLQQAQSAFSADLQRERETASAADALARDAIKAAEARSDAAARRALLEIDQARQALGKAERQRDGLQAEIAAHLERGRSDQVEQARATAHLQERLNEATSALAISRLEIERARAELTSAHTQLAEGQRAAGELRAEATTLRQVVSELSASMRAAGSQSESKRHRSSAARATGEPGKG